MVYAMSNKTVSVPAVPSMVFGLGESLQEKLVSVERRLRTEIGPVYPGSLLRFELITNQEQVNEDWLRKICDPLLTHPLWLTLQEQGLAEISPNEPKRPELSIYIIARQDDTTGQDLLPHLCKEMHSLYGARVRLRLNLFYITSEAGNIPTIPISEAPMPPLCFVLGPVKRAGFGTSGEHETYETIRLALNALLASRAGEEIEKSVREKGLTSPVMMTLGASAIVVARSQMETCLYSTILQRLVRACFEGQEDEEQCKQWERETKQRIATLFGVPIQDWDVEQYDEQWEKEVPGLIAGLFPIWTNNILSKWRINFSANERGLWGAKAGEDLYSHLQKVLGGGEQAEATSEDLTDDVHRIAVDIHRELERQEKALLADWSRFLHRTVASGKGCLVRLGQSVAVTRSTLSGVLKVLQGQHVSPVYLRSRRDRDALAEILAARSLPICYAYEMCRSARVPPGFVVLRLIPFTLLTMAVLTDLGLGWSGIVAGLAVGMALMILFILQQSRRLRKEYQRSLQGLCRLYEEAIEGIVLGEVRELLAHLYGHVALTGQRLQELAAELQRIEGKAIEDLNRALSELPAEDIYLERQLFRYDPWQRGLEQVSIDRLLSAPEMNKDETGPGNSEELVQTPASILTAVLNGQLPAAVLGTALVDALRYDYHLGGDSPENTRIEEMLVAEWNERAEQEFHREGNQQTMKELVDAFMSETMEAQQRRALPLWDATNEKQEMAFVVLNPEAKVAFNIWLEAHNGEVTALPTLQRDQISYLRCLLLKGSEDQPVEAKEDAPCSG